MKPILDFFFNLKFSFTQWMMIVFVAFMLIVTAAVFANAKEQKTHFPELCSPLTTYISTHADDLENVTPIPYEAYVRYQSGEAFFKLTRRGIHSAVAIPPGDEFKSYMFYHKKFKSHYFVAAAKDKIIFMLAYGTKAKFDAHRNKFLKDDYRMTFDKYVYIWAPKTVLNKIKEDPYQFFSCWKNTKTN